MTPDPMAALHDAFPEPAADLHRRPPDDTYQPPSDEERAWVRALIDKVRAQLGHEPKGTQ